VAGALGGALERRERDWRFLEEHLPGGGELDLAAGAHEQLGAEGALELADLGAQRRLGDVQPRGGTAEVELLGDGQEVANQARLKIDSPSLSIAWEKVLDENRGRDLPSLRAQFPFERSAQ
jgi:hypothetical protein